jgi:hypothetical protein
MQMELTWAKIMVQQLLRKSPICMSTSFPASSRKSKKDSGLGGK